MAEGVVQRRGVPQAQAVAERFGQQNLGAPVELADAIFPVAKVSRVDYPSMGGASVAALAANRSIIQLFNPAGSNTDLHCKRIWLSTDAATVINVRFHDAALATLATTIASMLRLEGSNQIAPIGQIRTTQGASVGTSMSFYAVVSQTTLLLDFADGDGQEFDGFILQPGRGLLIIPGSDNILLRATFEWFERLTA